MGGVGVGGRRGKKRGLGLEVRSKTRKEGRGPYGSKIIIIKKRIKRGYGLEEGKEGMGVEERFWLVGIGREMMGEGGRGEPLVLPLYA